MEEEGVKNLQNLVYVKLSPKYLGNVKCMFDPLIIGISRNRHGKGLCTENFERKIYIPELDKY